VKARQLTAPAAALLFALNAFLISRLWFANWVDQMGSVGGAFMAISRWAMRHWSDLSWFPLWFSGMPFLRVYQPGLHVTVAAFATATGLPVQKAYNIVTAFLYCLGPVTLFWLCYRLTGRRGWAFFSALVYSVFSPSVLFSKVILIDLGSAFFARRYQALVHYGEGPHTAAMTLLPLVIWSLYEAAVARRRAFIPISACLLAALVLTNWTGTVGLVMALTAFFLSYGAKMRREGLLRAAGIGVVAYLLASPWLPPSIVLQVPRNARWSDGVVYGATHALWWLGLVLALVALAWLFERINLDRAFRFFLLFFLFTAVVLMAVLWFQVTLVPQPHRWQLELEMALIPAVLFPLAVGWNRMPRAARYALLAILAAGVAWQVKSYRWYVHYQTLPIDMERTFEYRMAKWYEANLGDKRVFAPGSVSVWMNLFVDTPQMVGCCDQSVPAREQRIAFYTIYLGENAGERDAEISELWLRAYGAAAIGMSGPEGKEFFKAYRNPNKFDGRLPELWREGDDVIYAIPSRSHSLAHVIRAGQEVSREVENGLDVEPLRKYVAALEDPSLPLASARWLNPHHLRVEAPVERGHIISLQASFAPGWHAIANGSPARLWRDTLGQMLIDPDCAGPCTIDLVYDGGAEAIWTRVLQGGGIVICALWLQRLRRRPA
jgi:hypothetical protein